jgi:DNA-binding NtrC family response regulator
MDRSVLLVDDEPAILQAVGRYLERVGYEVFQETTGDDGIERYHRNHPDVVILDLRLPGVTGFELLDRFRELDAAVLMLTGHADVPTAVEAMKRGAENFLTKPVEMPHLVATLDRTYEKVRLKREVRLLRSRSNRGVDIEALGVSEEMVSLREQIELLARSERTTVLLTGESGTGKGFIARMLHQLSPRARAPFVDINCGGLTANFLDDELFGHERGAFTDAKERKEGLFELAAEGTVFLDEIGDLALELQPKLLKVLESKTFRRIGGTREIAVDLRLIAATNKDLDAAVGAGSFRRDLFYRLSVLPLHLPPVRDRPREDRLALLKRLLADVAAPGTTPEIESEALERLLLYRWPGNVREMRNVLERALILAGDGALVEVSHLPTEIRRGRRSSSTRYEAMSLDDVQHKHIERTLRFHKGNRTHAARELGISRATLIKKIKDYGLDGKEGS